MRLPRITILLVYHMEEETLDFQQTDLKLKSGQENYLCLQSED